MSEILKKVLKFGGTSVGTPERLKKVSEIIRTSHSEVNKPIAACVSAMSGTTKKEGTTSRLLQMLDFAKEKNISGVKEEIDFVTQFHKRIIDESIKNNDTKKEVLAFLDGEMESLFFFLKALIEIGEISTRSRDRVIAVGEIISACILTSVVNDDAGKKIAGFVNLNQVNTDTSFNDIDSQFFQRLEDNLGKLIVEKIKHYQILILTGYIGEIPGGIVEKIGRGYTDYTASMAAAGCNAAVLEIWKEVDGIFSADPRKVENARVLPQISYREAAELTFFGTEAIHPRTMGPCIRKIIPIHVKNVLNPTGSGTIVDREERPSAIGIGKAVTQKSNIAILSIESDRMNEAPGFIYKMGEIFFKDGVSIDMMATSEVSVSTTVHNIEKTQLQKLSRELETIGTVSIIENLSSISIIGHGLQHKVGVAGKVFAAMGRNGINIILISQGASELSISFVVKNEEAQDAVNILHKELLNQRND